MQGSLLQCVGPCSPGQLGPAHATFFAKQFFVSWSGVLVLAYTGFPQPLLNVKAMMDSECTGIAPENPGSKWPKTSLAAVNDGCAGITKQQLAVLHKICRAANSILSTKAADQMPIHFQSLSYVHFQNRFDSMTSIMHDSQD